MRGLTSIYVARGLASGLIKIGRTWNVKLRLQTLAAAVESLELLATVAAPPAFERELHRRFAAVLEPSRGREWFHDDGSVLAWVATLPESQRGSRVFVPGRKRPARRPAEQVATPRKVVRRTWSAEARARCWAAMDARRAVRDAARAADPLLYPLHARSAA